MADSKTNGPDPARCTVCRNTQQAPLAERMKGFTRWYFCDECLPRWRGQFQDLAEPVPGRRGV